MKERFELYYRLIDQLLACPEGEELELRQANSDLMDLGLLYAMQTAADDYAKNDNLNTAQWLQSLAQCLVEQMGFCSIKEMSEEYLKCLMEILKAVDENPTSEFVYPVLQRNLEKLNLNLGIVLSFWAQKTSSTSESEEAQKIAEVIFKFANLILEFPSGKIANKLELAIIAYQLASLVCTQTNFSYALAAIQNNLGIAYFDRIKGDQASNLEQAIKCYQKALRIRTETDYRYEWAETQHNLASAFTHRIRGDRADNLEKAIDCCQKALRIRTETDYRYEWAGTQHNLANAYSQRIRGDKAENLEKAIDCCQKALRIRTETDYRYEWAGTQYHLANAYSQRIKGDKADNLEKAIDCCQKALCIHTETDYPVKWAETQDSLAIVYINRIRGDRAENLEKAIECCQKALPIYKTDFRYNWAATHNYLAIAYSRRIRGDKADNLEQAIKCYQNALSIYTETDFRYEWAMTNNNLATAYSRRIRGDKADNLELTIKRYQNALSIYTETDFPYNWAMTQDNLANVYRDRIRGNKADNLELTIAYYHNALIEFTPEQHPFNCLQTARSLGNLHFTQENWQLAIQTYQKAFSAIEITRNWATSDLRRQEIIAESMDVYEKMIQACIKNGQLDLAIETTERSRARHLVDLMASNDLYQGGDIPEKVREYLEQYEHLQERINLLRSSSQSSDNRELATSETRWRSQESLATEIAEINELETEKQEIWQQLRRLDPILAGQQQVDPISFTQIQQLIDNDSTAILCCYSTGQDTYIFILYKDKPPQVHTCKGQKINILYNEFLRNNWLIPYRENFSTWKNNMPQVLAELSQRLQLSQLIENHLQGIEELIIIPHLWLHQIPFAALPVNKIAPTFPSDKDNLEQDSIPLTSSLSKRTDTRGMVIEIQQSPTFNPKQQQYLGDLFPLRILPSCQILNYCHQRPSLDAQTTMGIVENASGDLPYTAYECETLTDRYQVEPSQRLQGSQATVREYRQIASQVPILHSSHHGAANSANPLDSALILSDGNLSLGELLTPGWRKDLQNLSDVYLNNCETNFSVNEITDDLLSIATGFLCAGARSVVSTLWSVDDCASALLAIFYYEIRHSGASRPRALQQAQQKLRNLTGTQLQAEYLEQLKSSLNQQEQQAIANRANAQNSEEAKKYKELAEKIKGQIDNKLPEHCEKAYPFASPFYWAGFISQGLA